ncbi:helix-turn-helix domain-containing protein [Nocardiopsis quinghaiensis]|uniref:helix-turn-helix domain-containing protein n=1 Tax=Nocardiopsis quinghaiensis TaxID=464995 RepID=UPI00123BDA30|nr:helix-turn-helix transcriptional regulator [Nocardiopsis quinghaiensis]
MTEENFTAMLCKLRELSGLTQTEVASDLGKVASSVSRWENGEVFPRRATVEALDRLLDGRGQLVRAWQTETSGSPVPIWMRSAGSAEDKAVSIDTVTVSVVPGLVQSHAYARLVFRSGRPTASQEDIERLAQLRVGRFDALVAKNDPFVTAVFPESALRWVSDEVRVDQVKRLLSLVDRGKFHVHMIPVGSLVLDLVAPVQLYRLPDGSVIAASDHGAGNLVYEKPAHMERISSLVRDALARSLPVDHSVKLLESLL